MIVRQRWAQVGSSLRLVALALALAALMSVLLLLTSSRSASAQTLPTADYRFQDAQSSSVGTAPALTDIGPGNNTFTTATVDGASSKVLSFPQGNGLQLSPTTGVVSNGTYTIVVLFEFDSVDGYRRIVDFKNGTSDNGLYVRNGNLEFYPRAVGTGTPIAANTYVQVVLTRNSSGTVVGYVDGSQQFSFSDTSNDAVIDANNALRFFRDNESNGDTTEHSAGSVARIRLYGGALTASEVGALDRLEPTTFTVNSTGDEDDPDSRDGKCDVSATAGDQCTLRAAIQQANVTSGADTINFNIPGNGVHTITPISALPSIFDPLTIDGYSQPGASPNTLAVGNNAALKIELSGKIAEVATGIRITSSEDCVVKGLIINRWGQNGVEVTSPGDRNRIEGNFIGTDASGTADRGNSSSGVLIEGAPNNIVGGTTPGTRNVISGNNGNGVQIIGTDTMFPDNPNAHDNRIEGNYIGTDASGTFIGNGLGNYSGVVIIDAPNNIVGGTTPGARNVISGNNGHGVSIVYPDAKDNQVVGNYIGTDKNGTADLGNVHNGVHLFKASNNVVGGTTSGASNRISGNSGSGVAIETYGGVEAAGNRILRNSIFDNDGGLGINLEGGIESDEGVTRNDTGDADTGPNGLQNYPVITSAITSGGETTIKGTLNTTASDRLTIQFFSSSAADPSDFGEGKTYIGEIKVDTNLEGNTAFSFIPSTPLAAGQVVTATATSAFTNDTSEFSRAVAVNTKPTITNVRPAPGTEIRDRTPLIAATVRDAQTDLAKTNIKLFVDGNRKTTFSYDRSTDRLSYTSEQLSFGSHTVKVVATDGVLSTTRSWFFMVVSG